MIRVIHKIYLAFLLNHLSRTDDCPIERHQSCLTNECCFDLFYERSGLDSNVTQCYGNSSTIILYYYRCGRCLYCVFLYKYNDGKIRLNTIQEGKDSLTLTKLFRVLRISTTKIFLKTCEEKNKPSVLPFTQCFCNLSQTTTIICTIICTASNISTMNIVNLD